MPPPKDIATLISELESKTVAELHGVARQYEVKGHSTMNRDQLLGAVKEAVVAATVSPEPPSSESSGDVSLLRRVEALEAKVQALDDRTRGSSQILGRT